MKKTFLFLALAAAFILCGTPFLFASDKIRAVTTTSVFADFVRQIGKDQVDVYSIASPNRDIHFITPTPKDVVKLKKADVFVHGGLDLEAWRAPLLDAVGRPEFLGSEEKAIDVSKGISLLEIPQSLSRVQGDIHAFGNPHYWVNPENAKQSVANIAEKMAVLFPGKADFFRRNAEEYEMKLDQKIQDWTARLELYKGMPVITYHNSWPYFADRFGLEIAGYLEPKPGIPPTAKHLAELIKIMKEKKAKVIILEGFQEPGVAKKLAKETGAQVLTLSQTVTGKSENVDYLSMTESNVHQLESAGKLWKEARV